jgi:NAD(P)-dependent dehydrogenase (short-subunit alcohol dehydrogenase family)
LPYHAEEQADKYFRMDQEQLEKKAGKQKRYTGIEKMTEPRPEFIKNDYKSCGKLTGKSALITGGDSGIGRAISLHFAREGADIAIVYLEGTPDAQETRGLVEATGSRCLLIKGDVKQASFCRSAVIQTVDAFGKLNILVNNAGMQIPREERRDTSDDLTVSSFDTNIIAYFRFAKAALDFLHEGDCIINTTSIITYRPSPDLIDYSATAGAITTFTRSLATHLAKKKIRVNAVAPGPIWTPLIVSTFEEDKIKSFGKETSMQRAGQPAELGPAYVFLASDDASYITGQVIHINGGEAING